LAKRPSQASTVETITGGANEIANALEQTASRIEQLAEYLHGAVPQTAPDEHPRAEGLFAELTHTQLRQATAHSRITRALERLEG
jgi:hypothetical protein